MGVTLTVLGCGSAIPTSKRNPSAHLLNVNERFFLLDCGEGTQMQLRRNKLKMQRIESIFISHLHGDHFFGLIGLLTTMNLLGRTKELLIYTPAGLKEIIDIQLKLTGTVINYKLQYCFLQNNSPEEIVNDEKLIVTAIPLKHRIPCYGFFFSEKEKQQNIKKEYVEKYKIPYEEILKIKLGQDYATPDGKIISSSQMLLPVTHAKSFAYITDTLPLPEITEIISNTDLLYHEATFSENLKERAIKTFHSTAIQAAEIAKAANVKKLIIGHFSARYKLLDEILIEAKSVFENTVVAAEGETFTA
jgi:ribonuclease Z